MSAQEPLFSIIIPTYNVVSLLPTAVESVITQSYDNWEVIIMDGISNDGTIQLAQEYSTKDQRIKLFSEKDEGIYDAMNKAIDYSTGSYLHFLGSDDYFYDDQVLESVAGELTKAPVDVIYGDVYSPRFNGRYAGKFTPEKLAVQNICHQAMFVHHKVFQVKGNFSLEYTAHADYLHNLTWFLDNNITRKYIDRIIAYYADGGFSSVHGDSKFDEKKSSVFFNLALKHGHYKAIVKDTARLLKIRKKRFTAWLKRKDRH